MADKLLSSITNLVGGSANKTKVLDVPAANFDKCVITNIGVANKNQVTQDQVYITLVRGAQTITLVPGQPISTFDAWCSKEDMSIHLQAGDQLWVEGKNAGQNLDVIINYLLSDTL